MKRVFPLFLGLLAVAALAPSQLAAQCGQCYLEAIAALHKAPEQGLGNVENPHNEWADGVCYDYHGHDPCFQEDEQQVLTALTLGSEVELPSLLALLERHESKVSFPADRLGFEIHACGDPTDVSFVPLPEQTLQAVAKALQDRHP